MTVRFCFTDYKCEEADCPLGQNLMLGFVTLVGCRSRGSSATFAWSVQATVFPSLKIQTAPAHATFGFVSLLTSMESSNLMSYMSYRKISETNNTLPRYI